MQYFGDFLEDATVRIPFNTFSSNDPQASVTITNLADADLHVHKDGGTTQIATDGATISIDFDSITGNHYAVIDTSAHADYSTGSEYAVRMEGTTVDGGTINAWIGSFSIENRSSSLSATALANLISQYDTTGLSGDNFPATQSQLGGIANVGSAIHKPAASYTLTTGTQSANTYTSTEALDGTRHEHTDDTGAMDLYYEFAIGSGVPSSVQVSGYVTGPNDDLDADGYDWVAASWVQIGNMQGSSSTSNSVSSFDMFVDMVGTGANAGTVRVRFHKASGLTTALLAIDQIFIAFSQDAVSSLDAVYFDSGASNTGTTSIDGVPGNPVSSEAAVNTLLANRNLYKVEVALESSITFATSHVNESWRGVHWTCALGGQNVSGAHFRGADISGIGTSSSDPIDFDACDIGTCTLHQFHAHDCDFDGTVTFGEAGNYLISGSHSGIAGATTPIFDTGAAIANVSFIISGWYNGLEIQNLNNSGTDLFSIAGIGQIVYAASSSGAVNQRGDWRVTNTGGVTITEDDNTANTSELQTDWADGGRLDLIQDIIAVDTTTDIPALIAALNNISSANVLTQVNAALDTAIIELGVAAPAVTPTLRTGLMLMYMMARNRVDVDTTGADAMKIYNDAGTQIASKLITDDGTDYSEAEMT